MKRFLIPLLSLALLCAAFSGCARKETASKISMYDLSKSMLGATQFGEMRYVSNTDDDAEEEFEYLSDLDYKLVDSWFLSYAADGKGNADEVAVIRVKQEKDVDRAVSSLKAHLDKRVALYKTYDPSQSEKVGRGVVFSDGSFAVLIVSGDNQAVRKAFRDFLAQQ